MRLCDLHLIDLAVMLEDSTAQKEGEEQFVLLKETAAHIAVETERKVFVDVLRALSHVICQHKPPVRYTQLANFTSKTVILLRYTVYSFLSICKIMYCISFSNLFEKF